MNSQRLIPAVAACFLAAAATTAHADVSIESVRCDKLIYQPGEKALCRLTLTADGDAPASAELEIELRHELSERRVIYAQPIRLEADRQTEVEAPFTAGPDEFGYEIIATLRADGETLAARRDYFSVARNFFDVGIGATKSPIMTDRPANCRQMIDEARRDYANWFDVFFWSPCDWALHVSPLDRWWSGQTSYRHIEANLHEFIREGHARGIKMAMYASCNPAGPFGWEAARAHPEWFVASAGKLPSLTPANVEALDHWNDPQWRIVDGKPRPHPGWLRLRVDLRGQEALDYGIDRIIEGAKHYGWDAVRFDGHYTIAGHDEISTRNMRRLKERVWSELPDFRFGFNYGRAPEWKTGVTHEMREGMAGGGLYMQEGVRAWRYTSETYTSWKHYAQNELRVAKTVYDMGGSYHCIWDLPRELAASEARAQYKMIYGLIAGGHPAYAGFEQVPGCRSWGAFMTRNSAFLWDRNIRPVDEPEKFITVDAPKPVQWAPLVQRRVVSEDREQLLIHLVNPPPDDAIEKMTDLPPAIDGLRVTLRLPPQTSFRQARLIQPEATPFGRKVQPQDKDGSLVFSVPKLNVWALLVVELEGRFDDPKPRPRFTEPPDAEKVQAALKTQLAAATFDPNKPNETLDVKPNERIWETDSGFSGIPSRTIADTDATGGIAQHKTYPLVAQGGSQRFLGRTWLGPLTPGKYRLSYRVKWNDSSSERAWQAYFYVTDVNRDVDVVRITTLTPNCFGEAGAKFDKFVGRKTRDNLSKLEPPGEFRYFPVEFELRDTGYVNSNIILATDAEGPQEFFLDHIKTELIEPFSDEVQARLNPVDNPEGLRTPQGTSPAKVLVVRGLYADKYAVAEAIGEKSQQRGGEESAQVGLDEAYDLPTSYEDLYRYDAVVLANVDVTLSEFRARKMLKNWVEAGGRLVILGGISTLGQGGMQHTYLEEMAPVTLKGANELARKRQIMGPKPGQPYPDQPAVTWTHQVEFRRDAKIIAYAGTQPIAGWRTEGAGRVYAFTGTVLGATAGDAKPFWESKSWRNLLRAMVMEQ